MNAINVNPRAMIARVGAALAAFVLAFSLLGVTSPAHADSFKVWLGMKFSGENVAISLKMHAPSEYGSTKTICDAMKKSATTSSDGKVTKSGIEQYKGVEVCVIEAEGKLSENDSSSAFGFSIKRDGDKLTIKSTSSNRFASVGDIEYRFTFDDGIVSSSGGKVEGNTFVTTDTKFEVVGKPGGTSKILMYALIGALIGGGTGWEFSLPRVPRRRPSLSSPLLLTPLSRVSTRRVRQLLVPPSLARSSPTTLTLRAVRAPETPPNNPSTQPGSGNRPWLSISGRVMDLAVFSGAAARRPAM